MSAPKLEGEALAAVDHRGSHLQIIAAAGSGKTEVVSQRVTHLLAEGVPPHGIVAFTFTERAAEELKNRIARRVAEYLGTSALDMLSGLSVGTIHSYCFRMLQQRLPRYESYDVLDDNRLTAFLAREATRLNIRQLDAGGRLFASIKAFLSSTDVVENELLDPGEMPEPYRSVLLAYLDTLERYRLLTYGQQIVRTIRELDDEALLGAIHGELRHLIVDEYQDVNPAQERLIELLTGPRTELCVVGDDDQAIYQWRGSDVANITGFARRYPDVRRFEITTNRRSRPTIIERANRFARTIPERLDKTMLPHREAAAGPEIVTWHADTEAQEAGRITGLIHELHGRGIPYRDMAVLVRGRAAYPRLVESFAASGIPVQPGGRTGLFEQPEAVALGRAIAWLTELDWRRGHERPQPIADDALFDEFTCAFRLGADAAAEIPNRLRDWKLRANAGQHPADLVGELYQLYAILGVAGWDLSDPVQVNRIGTLARFTTLLADYEAVRRRARPDAETPGAQVGGQDRGTWYYRNLGLHIINYASGAFEGFDGEPDMALDAVDLTTVHRAKGLEWPVVFVPSLTKSRFPSSNAGKPQERLVPREMYDASRYEGSDADERRLFYVAMTRARDWLSLSRHQRVTKRSTAAGPYWSEHADFQVGPDDIPLPDAQAIIKADDEPVTITFSEMAQFLDCGMAYRLRSLIGFQPRIAPELGYGKAVHHVLRTIAEATRSRGTVPTQDQLNDILDGEFFLPSAGKTAHRQLKRSAGRLIARYASEHPDDLFRVWETERSFELHLDGVTVSGRADVILDREDGADTALAILDYKTSTGDLAEHRLQLQVYADAGRREGLDVRAAYVHDLRAGARAGVSVEPGDITTAEQTMVDAARKLRARDFTPRPGKHCATCEVRAVCGSAAADGTRASRRRRSPS